MASKSTAAAQGFIATEEATAAENESIAIPIDQLKFSKVELRTLIPPESDYTLPVGMFLDGERLHRFTLHEYTGEMELAIGRLIRSSPGKLVKILKEFLPMVIKDIGGYPLKDLAARTGAGSAPRLIEGMFLGDVLMMVLAIRHHYQGTDIAITAKCPQCGTKNEDSPAKGRPYHDLGTVEVTIVEHLKQKLVAEVTLEDGIKVFDQICKKLHLQPLRFFEIEKLAKPDNFDPEDFTMVYTMVRGIPESEEYREVRGQVIDQEMYVELLGSKADKRIMQRALRKLQPGPDMAIALDCFRCQNEWQEALSWGDLRGFLYFIADPTE